MLGNLGKETTPSPTWKGFPQKRLFPYLGRDFRYSLHRRHYQTCLHRQLRIHCHRRSCPRSWAWASGASSALPLCLCLQEGKPEGKDWLGPTSSHRETIDSQDILKSLKGNRGHPRRKHDTHSSGHEDQEPASTTTAQHPPSSTRQHLPSSQC